MKSIPFAFMIVFCVAIWEFGSTNPVALSCDSCGSECARACGTRHFRSCCFNYVRKRSAAFHPYSLNKMRFETLYRQFPFGSEDKMSNKNEKEQKPRQESSLPLKSGSSQNEITDDGSMKQFYKPWKEDVDDYDEQRRAAIPRQQQIIYDA